MKGIKEFKGIRNKKLQEKMKEKAKNMHTSCGDAPVSGRCMSNASMKASTQRKYLHLLLKQKTKHKTKPNKTKQNKTKQK